MNLLNLFRNKTEFKYGSQLDSDTIRLVRFRQSQILGLLSLDLTTHSLREVETIDYHALSYTWGPPKGNGSYTSSDLKSISVDGKRFLVYRNLHDALIRLRESGFAEYYWIDAICIDQTNETEREVQVSIMNHIYTGASQVDVWVGKSAKDSPRTVNLIYKLAELHQTHANELLVQNLAGTAIDRKMKKLGLPARDSTDWTSVSTFFHRNWFKRSWIIQEVAMAESTVLIWGKHDITWEVISGSISMMHGLNLSPEPHGARVKLTAAGRWSPISVFYGPSMIMTVRKLFNSDDDYGRRLLPEIQQLTGIDAWTKSASPMLALLLMHCRKFQAKDQRDKVYSLLGMANRAATYRGAPKSTINVDYQSSTAAVFEAATKTIIEDCNHLGFISVASLVTHDGSEDLTLTPDLPSWVPDLSTSAAFMGTFPLLAGHLVKWDASQCHERSSLGFRILGPQLHVKGIRIGALSAGSLLAAHIRSHGFEPFAALLLRYGQRYRPTGELSIEAFWRTLICGKDPNDSADHADMLSGGPDLRRPFSAWLSACILLMVNKSKPSGLNRLPDGQRENYEALVRRDGDAAGDLLSGLAWLDSILYKMNYLESSEGSADLGAARKLYAEFVTNDHLASRYEKFVGTWASERRFFVTDEGHMGLGVPSVTEGDIVWVLSSCPVPLILRARADGSYQLIGDSYVHGAMYGEAVDGREWEDICIT